MRQVAKQQAPVILLFWVQSSDIIFRWKLTEFENGATWMRNTDVKYKFWL